MLRAESVAGKLFYNTAICAVLIAQMKCYPPFFIHELI